MRREKVFRDSVRGVVSASGGEVVPRGTVTEGPEGRVKVKQVAVLERYLDPHLLWDLRVRISGSYDVVKRPKGRDTGRTVLLYIHGD